MGSILNIVCAGMAGIVLMEASNRYAKERAIRMFWCGVLAVALSHLGVLLNAVYSP